MVRLKHRYLLAHILYPDTKDNAGSKPLKNSDEAPYIVQFHRPSSDRLDARLLQHTIRNAVSELFGDYGSGMVSSSLQVKYFSPATSTAIIRVSRDHYRLVWSALTFTTKLPRPVDEPCVIQVVRVSGTIKKSEEAAIRLARQSIKRAQKQAAGSQTNSKAHATASTKVPFPDEDSTMNDVSGFVNGIEDTDGSEDENDDED